jgi:hypothetical protein
MPLKDVTIRNAKPREKEYTLGDGAGLALVIRPDRAPIWVYRYAFAGKRRKMSLGEYPEVSLATARNKRIAAEAALAAGKDPPVARKATPADNSTSVPFRTIGDEWLAKQDIAQATRDHEAVNLGKLYESIGDRPVADITSKDII